MEALIYRLFWGLLNFENFIFLNRIEFGLIIAISCLFARKIGRWRLFQPLLGIAHPSAVSRRDGVGSGFGPANAPLDIPADHAHHKPGLIAQLGFGFGQAHPVAILERCERMFHVAPYPSVTDVAALLGGAQRPVPVGFIQDPVIGSL